MKKIKIFLISILLGILLFAGLCFWAYTSPTGDVAVQKEGFRPVQDDPIAARFAPYFIESDAKNPMIALYYRAAWAKDGTVLLAYHPVWPYEKNEEGKGFNAFLSRNVYTGGLSLQKIMYGKGDVELISSPLSPDLKPLKVSYERPENYSLESFSVKHKTVELEYPLDKERLVFTVASWNHLFELLNEVPGSNLVSLKPEYFSRSLWEEYSMVKKSETRILKDRAHEEWEIEAVR